jgi:hypothetical protein
MPASDHSKSASRSVTKRKSALKRKAPPAERRRMKATAASRTPSPVISAASAPARRAGLDKKQSARSSKKTNGAKTKGTSGGKRTPQRRKDMSYNVDYAERRAPWSVPVWWVNTVFAIFLLVPLGIWNQTFFTSFRDEAIHRGFWATEEFWFFGLGVVMWLIVFISLPRPILIYVFGHEATHAIWAIAMGGRVSEFKVASDGGYIVTDTNNFWIALAPYFFPIYSLAVIAIYSGLSLFFNVEPYVRWFYGGLGATWAFHICFTLWMIPKGQTDLTYHGTFFSLVVISIMNLVVLTLFLIAASPEITWVSFGTDLLQNTMDFSEWIVSILRQLRRSL